MKKTAIVLAVAGLAAAGMTPAAASAAPPWSYNTAVSGTLYGTEGSYDGYTWTPGTITDGDVDVDINQGGSPTVNLISIHVGNGASLSGYSSVDVYGIGGDSCNTGSQVVSVSGDQITIKGVSCWDYDTDGTTEAAIDVRGLTGSINSYWFDDHEIDGQFRYNASRRYKAGSYRYENDFGLDFVSGD